MPDNNLVKSAGRVLLGAAVPAAAVVALRDWVTANPLSAGCALLLYEAALWALGLFRRASTELQEQLSKKIAEKIRLGLSGNELSFEREYLRYVKVTTSHIESRGLLTVGDYSLRIADIYIPLDLEARAPHALTAGLLGRDERPLIVKSVDEWVEEARRDALPLVLIGPPGSGKTTMLRQFAHDHASRRSGRRRRLVPIIVNLRELGPQSDIFSQDLQQVIEANFPKLTRDAPLDYVRNSLQGGRFIVMFDGMDELDESIDRRRMADWLAAQTAMHSKNSFIITSRPLGYSSNKLPSAIVTQLKQLKKSQIEQFVQKWYERVCARSYGDAQEAGAAAARDGSSTLIAAIRGNPNLIDLASNPLLLTMIANVHHYRGALPRSRFELYHELCDVLLGRRAEVKGITSRLTSDQKASLLRDLAFETMLAGRREFSSGDAEAAVAVRLARIDPTMSTSNFIRDIEASTGLLLERESGVLAFAHPTIQEYLCAESVRDKGAYDFLADRAFEPWWRETILLFLVNADGTGIIDRIIGEPTGENIGFAVACMAEAREVAASTRHKLDALLNPKLDTASDEELINAGIGSILARRTRDQPGPAANYLAHSPITKLEAAAMSATRSGQLDRSALGRKQEDLCSPALGFDLDDALTLCSLLQPLLGDERGLQVSLPGYEDFAHPLPLQNGARYWVRPDAGLVTESRYWPIIRDFGGIEMHSTRPIQGPVSPSVLQEAAAYEVAEYPCSEEHREHIRSLVLRQSARQTASELQVTFHANRLLATSELCARDLAAFPGSDGWVTLAQRIVDALVPPLAKERYLLGPNLSKAQILTARAACLQGVEQSVTSYINAGGQLPLPDLHTLTKDLVRAARDRRVVSLVLARAFAFLYQDLIDLQLRPAQPESRQAFLYVLERPDSRADSIAQKVSTVSKSVSVPKWHEQKRPLDFLGAGLAILVLAPAILLTAVLVHFTSPGPVLYRSTRVGKNGQHFQMYKFRSMRFGADKQRLALINQNEGAGPLFKMRDDPRVTPLGRFLRRYSLDELPQIFNVLRGEMSLVGPRPSLPSEVGLYGLAELSRLLVRPGLTGLWQISGRSDLSWDNSVRMDRLYVEGVRPALDAKILIGTIVAVFRGSGAY